MTGCGHGAGRSPGGAPAAASHVPAGVTLIEVVIALLLLAVGALALAGGITSSERARRSALTQAMALSAAEGWLEAWRSSPWKPAPAAGADTLAWGAWRGRLEWSVTPLGPCLAEASVAAMVLDRRTVLVSRRFREQAAGCGG